MEVTKYHICFWDKEQNQNHYHEKIVKGFILNPYVFITRELGLRALTYSTFEVRAYSGDDVSQECKTISKFIGMYIPSVHYYFVCKMPQESKTFLQKNSRDCVMTFHDVVLEKVKKHVTHLQSYPNSEM